MLYSIVHSIITEEDTMDKQEIAQMKRKVRTLQKKLAELGPVMRGSIVLIGSRNKQYYFSLNKDKKTHIIYLGKKRVNQAKEYSDNYKKLLEIIEEMTILNMKLVKEDT
jgi:small-conductance mechanosensitive channel